MKTRTITLTITEGEGIKPDVKIEAREFNGPDLLFHLNNVVNIIHTQVIAQTVLQMLKPSEPLIVPGAVPTPAVRWPPTR
jgi:hypothetical protein